MQDEIVPSQAVDVVWNFHTSATVQISKDGRSATLRQGGVTLNAHILQPTEARFSTTSTQVPRPQSPNPGLTNIVIPLARQTAPQTIAVLFTQFSDESVPALKPLSTWK